MFLREGSQRDTEWEIRTSNANAKEWKLAGDKYQNWFSHSKELDYEIGFGFKP